MTPTLSPIFHSEQLQILPNYLAPVCWYFCSIDKKPTRDWRISTDNKWLWQYTLHHKAGRKSDTQFSGCMPPSQEEWPNIKVNLSKTHCIQKHYSKYSQWSKTIQTSRIQIQCTPCLKNLQQKVFDKRIRWNPQNCYWQWISQKNNMAPNKFYYAKTT